ncbi:MAG: glycosyltransferase family 9 protein [Endomicrobiales bacterium]|nr:glycosyltransferase family 9 protein [Endomicrobiales bacterium]
MNQLGDLLFSLPVLSAARKQWPGRKILSVVRPELAELLEETGLVDEVVPKPRSLISGKLKLIKKLRSEKIDEVVLFSESPESVILGRACGASKLTGFSTAALSVALTGKIDRKGVPSIENNRNLGKKIGLNDIPEDYCNLVRIPEAGKKLAGEWLKKNNIPECGFIVASHGTSRRRREKNWLDGKWAELFGKLSDKGFCTVVTGAPSQKREIDALVGMTPAGSRVFGFVSEVAPFAALLSLAKAFVGVDSGAMHLAASLNVPVVALFGPTDPEQVGPRPNTAHLVIKKEPLSGLSVEDVLKGLDRCLL